MHGMLPAPLAKLLILQLSFNRLFILSGIVIKPLTVGTFHPY